MLQYFFDKNNNFMIEDYHKSKPFSSFLPGISGRLGIPIWTFYVNRGQCISGFGIRDKDNPIMEFFPANSAYQYISTYGFRTFIKIDGVIIEPFNRTPDSNKRIMGITRHHFFIEEVLEKEEIKIRVTYGNLSNIPLGGLIRRVEISNLSSSKKTIEVIDGMPAILPYGVTNSGYKEMSNLVRSWMDVTKTETKIPFYHLRASTHDEAEVETVHQGYFYMNNSLNDHSVATIYDTKILFDYKTDLSYPVGFESKTIEELSKTKQVAANKVPCGFQGKKAEITGKGTLILDSIYGYCHQYEIVEEFTKELELKSFIDKQFTMSREAVDLITNDINTSSNIKPFDEYLKQSYLDNIMRGGKPIIFGSNNKEKVYHIYSRKHGDQERDYNFFSLEPTCFSQGNGNYRDMNQNRRHDLLFEPRVKDFNVWMFYNLVQTDGYNPLSVNGITFSLNKLNIKKVSDSLLNVGFKHDFIGKVVQNIENSFTPGSLIEKISGHTLGEEKTQLLLNIIIPECDTSIEAEFGEGFWSDHFTYNLDLIEDYLTLYPDKKQKLLFERKDYKTYHSPYYVLPRDEKYGRTKTGVIRQYGAIMKNENFKGKWMLDESGEVSYMDLFGKLMMLTLTKFLNLDPSCMGIEMEGNKPGWNDALNGLPGLFGSGTSESVELLRNIQFLITSLKESNKEYINLIKPIYLLVNNLSNVMKKEFDAYNNKDLFGRWNDLNYLKDEYRNMTRDYLESTSISYKKTGLVSLLEKMKEVITIGLERALILGNGLLPSYIIHEVDTFELTGTTTTYGLEGVKVISFKPRILPMFLEGPARLMKISDKKKALEIYNLIKNSDIYDKQLQMYKTSASLEDESMEIGRIKAFTPGWLERESIFLHMTYKYILGILKAGLYEIFYEEIKTNLIPFLNPEVYGRPTTENSSFIASSKNPDSEVVGQGFVARLSGSTAEVLSMWKIMFVGKKWFSYNGTHLRFDFAPILSKEFFDENGEVSFRLLGKTNVTYINKKLLNTYGQDGVKVSGIDIDGVSLDFNYLNHDYAVKLRNQEFNEIKVFFE